VFVDLDLPLTWRELAKRTVEEFQEDNALGLAAQLAYYFFLALFPTLLFLLALASFFPLDNLAATATGALRQFAPPAMLDIIRDQIQGLSGSSSGGILSFGVIAALWSSSAAMVAIIDALDRAYDVEDQRPWWKQRLTAVALTLAVALFILVSLTLVLAGPQLAEFLADQVGLGIAFEWGWKILQWPLVFALVGLGISLIYYYAPDVDQDFIFMTPGSIVATLLWLAGSLLFRVYITRFGSYNETYGAIGGVMVLMLWLYMSGLAILFGAELNAEIEHASPHGKNPGEKVPGQKRMIGPRAARARKARQGSGGTPLRPAPAPAAATPRPTRSVARSGGHVAGVRATRVGKRNPP
jgi:membrane protein